LQGNIVSPPSSSTSSTIMTFTYERCSCDNPTGNCDGDDDNDDDGDKSYIYEYISYFKALIY
jgi:hypothetical protein